MSEEKKDFLLTTPTEGLNGLNTYIEGKMKRYSLLFTVNGGAFAIAKLLGEPRGSQVVGGLGLRSLAIGAVLFTVLMWRDIYLFGEMMRSKFLGGELVFDKPGKRILGALCSLLILGWLIAAFWPQRVAADTQAIRELARHYAAAHNAANVEAIITLYAENGIVLPPDVPIRNREETRSALRSLYNDFTVQEVSSPEEIHVQGDWAFDRGTTTGTTRPKAGGPPTVFNNKYVRIWRRQGDGSWKITHTIFNRNTPPPYP